MKYLNGLRVKARLINDNAKASYSSKKSILDMLNCQINKNNEKILNFFLRPSMKVLNLSMRNYIDNKIQLELNFRFYILISFLLIVVLGYLILWLPFQYSLNDEISRTKNMLNIIPNSILDEVNSIINDSII